MLNPEFKAKWLTALRSGKYQQCRYALTQTGSMNTSYCCIGVAAAVAGYGNERNNILRPGELKFPRDRSPYAALEDFGLHDFESLVRLNDDQGQSFAQIADYIEGNL